MADCQPWYVGQTSPTWDIPLTRGGAAENLTGVDITKFTWYFRTLNGIETQGTGTITLKTPYPGEIFYKPSVADVTTMNGTISNGIFSGTVFVVALYPPSFTNADEVIFDPAAFSIKARGSL